MVDIVPAIIPQDFTHLSEEMQKVAKFVPKVQIDVVDGVYAKPASWPYNGKDAQLWEDVQSQTKGMPLWETLSFEVDLMVEAPEEKIDNWISAGADTLIIHLETTQQYADIWKRCAERGAQVALALKPSTDFSKLEKAVSDIGRDNISFIQCMGNDDIGRHGVVLDEKVFVVIERIKNTWSDVTIGIDIGVTRDTAPRLVSAGFTHLASGSAILQSDNVKESIEYFKNLSA